MANKGDPIVAAFIGFVGGVFIFYYGFKQRAKYRLIMSTPTSKIRSVAVGICELHGQAQVLDAPLISPFSMSECVYYRYDVQEHRRSGKSSRWVSISQFSSTAPFLLRDDTGSIVVEPEGAEMHAETDNFYKTQLFSSAAEEKFKQGLARIGIDPSGFFGDRPLRCFETLIVPGNEIYVLGTAKIDQRRAASEQNEENLCVGASGKNYFCLSDESEKKLVGELGFWSIICIFAGPVVTLVSLGYILYRAGYL